MSWWLEVCGQTTMKLTSPKRSLEIFYCWVKSERCVEAFSRIILGFFCWWLGIFLSHFRIDTKTREKKSISRSIDFFNSRTERILPKDCAFITAFFIAERCHSRAQQNRLQNENFERRKCNDIIKIKGRNKSSFSCGLTKFYNSHFSWGFTPRRSTLRIAKFVRDFL